MLNAFAQSRHEAEDAIMQPQSNFAKMLLSDPFLHSWEEEKSQGDRPSEYGGCGSSSQLQESRLSSTSLLW